MKQALFALLLVALLSGCGGDGLAPPPAAPSTAGEPLPSSGNAPNEIRELNAGGFDFEWKQDHWEARNVARSTVFYYYPLGLGDLDPGFGYSSSVELEENAITAPRRDFFQAFGVDDATQLWMLQLGEAILTDGESGGKSCRGGLCCNFVFEYPEYRFYCMPN